MPRIPIFRLGGAPEKPALPNLAASTPSLSLEGIIVGVDNLRHDVVLSPRFVEAGAGADCASDRASRRAGGIAGGRGSAVDAGAFVDAESGGQGGAPEKRSRQSGNQLLTELQVASLNRAKKEFKLSVDLLARLAVTKFLRTEMSQQFLQVLERCRVLLKSYDNMRAAEGA